MIDEEKIFQENYADTLEMLERKSKNRVLDIASIEGELDSLYVYEGLDWTGRGAIKNSEIGGKIAAYQIFIHNYFHEQQVPVD